MPAVLSLRATAGAILAIALAACSQNSDTHRFEPGISAADLSEQTRILASDDFGGRPPSGPGADKTVAYLTDEFSRLGLSPAFADSYLQPVPLVSITAAPTARLAISGEGHDFAYRYGDEMMVWTTRVTEQARLEDSELVFVGYGINAPERDWNDYAGIDMAGKTAVMLVNDPGFATGNPELFDGKAMTYYGRWTYKYEEAARQGAAGAIIIHETAPASYGWSVVENSWTGEQFDLVRDDGNMSRVAVEGWVQRDVASEFLAAAGNDLEALKQAAATQGFTAVPLGLEASVTIDNELRESGTHNVAATLYGTERPDEHVIYTAHWDHLGSGPAVDGDSIYNGAADNAAGVATVLEIAARMSAEPPERSVTFLLVGAEEQGLLGAYHYAENPAYPLAKTAALINIDVLLPMGETTDITVIGRGSSEIEQVVERLAAEQDRTVTPYANPEQGFYFRSDHFAFARRGVPALYLDTGTVHVTKGADYITQTKANYVANVYHTPFDEWRPDWDWTGAELDVKLLYRTGRALANTTDWPEWYEGNPFRAIRAQSAAERAP
ncbi:MAG: M28 family metallopeptidase [Woeseia sp.]